jgi:lysophospholipase L1-like esterase
MDKTTVTTPGEKPNTPTSPIELVVNTYDFCNNRESFKRYGRMTERKDGLTCDFTASGVEFYGILQGDVILSLSCSADTYFTVFIDGVRQEERFYATSSTEQLCIASFAEAGEHTVCVLKQTEAQWSLCVLRSVSVTGFLYPAPAEREFLIEFIDDSITCGYGNMRPDVSADALLAETQNGMNTYAAIAATRLDADISVFARSGIGLYTTPHSLTYHMTDVYDRVSPMSNASQKWDMQVNAPDVVILNLGTNDSGANATNSPQPYNANDFKQACVTFVKTLQEAYGKEDIIFILCTGMMVKGVTTPTAEAATILQSEGINAYALDLPIRSHSSGHPLYSQHMACADILYEKIVELLTQ